jgi:hypothetical protein
MMNQNKKFKGGIRTGYRSNTWPFGTFEVNPDTLIIRDELLHKEYKFSRDQVIEIEIKKILPIIGWGIRVHHKNTNYPKRMIFWYWSFQFNNLLSALKEFGWSVDRVIEPTEIIK